MDAKDTFRSIYRENGWGDPESRSGPGSSVHRTRLLRPALERLLRERKVQSLLDVPCGDFNWMRLADLRGISYTGVDIVDDIVQRNNSLYANDSRSFLCLDMTRDSLPKADLVLCRDGLVHLSFCDIGAALDAVIDSGARYLLTTTFEAHARNDDIQTGEWRPLNLQLPPLSFPAPLDKVWDGPRPDGTYPDKMLSLYSVAEIASSRR